MTLEHIMKSCGLEGFYKVDVIHGGYIEIGVFYNPDTKEVRNEIIRDDRFPADQYDSILCELPVDDDAYRTWEHDKGHLLVGDKVRVVKGAKVKKGTESFVCDIEPVFNKYKKQVDTRIYLSNGEETYQKNVVLVA